MPKRYFSALKIALIYALIAGLWIVFSDQALEAWVGNAGHLTQMQTYKGGFFVCVTAIVLFVLILRTLKATEVIHQFDPLTGLLNHHMFAAQLERKVAMRKPQQMLVVVYLDVDHFALLNQEMGFAQANNILINFSRVLKSHYSANVLIARFPPDQFAIGFLSDKTAGQIEADVKALKQLFDKSMLEQQVESTCTMGVALGPEDGKQAKAIMEAAATALSQGKLGTRNSFYFFNKSLSELEYQRQMLVKDLRHDLAQERLSLVYQPQYRLSDGAVMGVEVLIRWNHQEQGFIPPDVFIPIAEEQGLSQAITRFVVRRAYQELNEHDLLGQEIKRVSINISAVEFNSRKLLDALLIEIEKIPVFRQYLQIEITETATLNNIEQSAKIIKNLKQQGLKFSVDDFGTGYTSLAMLKDLPIDEVKIDRSFVDELDGETKAKAIIEAIVGMTHGFDISVIAEGIETQQQLDLLRDMGCSEGQGYFLARPMGIADLSKQYGKQRVPS